jgi:hypothetical protein
MVQMVVADPTTQLQMSVRELRLDFWKNARAKECQALNFFKLELPKSKRRSRKTLSVLRPLNGS